MKRKFLNSLYVFVLIISIYSLSVASTVSCFSATTPQITVGRTQGEAGDMVDITIKISDNPGFVSANLYVKYDESVLTLKKVKDGGLLSGVTHSDNYTSPYGLCWINDLSTENFKVNGVLATLTFEISKESQPGETEIHIEQDIIDCNVENVNFTLVSGKIEIVSSSQSKGSDLSKSTGKTPNSDSNVNSVDDIDKNLNNSKNGNQTDVKDSDASDINEKSDDYGVAISSSGESNVAEQSATSNSATNKGEGSVQTASIFITIILIVAIILLVVLVYYKQKKKGV